MDVDMNANWCFFDWKNFAQTHGYCPLCSTYHTLFLDNELYYCPANLVKMSGWTYDLYIKLTTNPYCVKISEYNKPEDKSLKELLLKTLPLIIERRALAIEKVEEYKRKTQRPQVIVRESVQKVNFPKDKGYWNRVSESFD